MKIIELNQESINLIKDQSNWDELNLDKTKGFIIFGPCGVGKTTAMNEFATANKLGWGHPKQPTMYANSGRSIYKSDLNSQGLSRLVAAEGTGVLNLFKEHVLYLDDIGAEDTTTKHYGQTTDPIESLLEIRYNHREQVKTYATSNLSLKRLEERYGERIKSRLFEMFNVIVLKGEDRRLV